MFLSFMLLSTDTRDGQRMAIIWSTTSVVELSVTPVLQFKPNDATIKRFHFICNHTYTNNDELCHVAGKPHNLSSQGAISGRRRRPLTCIVVHVVDLHGRLGSVVAEASVLLQQLQTFIAVKHGAPAVVRTQHCHRYNNHNNKKK